MEPRASHVLGKCFTTVLHPNIFSTFNCLTCFAFFISQSYVFYKRPAADMEMKDFHFSKGPISSLSTLLFMVNDSRNPFPYRLCLQICMSQSFSSYGKIPSLSHKLEDLGLNDSQNQM